MAGKIVPVYWDGAHVADVHEFPQGYSINVFESESVLRRAIERGPDGVFNDYIKAQMNLGVDRIDLQNIPGAEPLRKENLPMVFGWRLANELELRGRLLPGDIRFNQNDTLSYWFGDLWEPLDIHGSVV